MKNSAHSLQLLFLADLEQLQYVTHQFCFLKHFEYLHVPWMI